ncbi:MAG: malate dehydrogenase, partial [Paracoccaceae bacterium]
MAKSRVIGSEHIEDARQRSRIVFEILPGDIVTALARETAVRLGIKLVDGPIEKVVSPLTDGNTALRRGLLRRSPKWIAPKQVAGRGARRLTKLALVGAGGVGSNIAHLAANADLADEIVLIDIVPGSAAATAMDLNHASGITGTRARCIGGEDLALVSGADVIVVTAG